MAKPPRISDIVERETASSGKRVSFTLETDSGSFPFRCDNDLLHEMIQSLFLLSDGAARARTKGRPKLLGADRIEVRPIPTTEIGIMTSPDPDTVLLVVRNYDVDLAFELGSSQLRDLSQAAAQISQALEADSRHSH